MPALLWLPARRRLAPLVEAVPDLRRVIASATRLADAAPGMAALWPSAFDAAAAALPAAALTRRVDAPHDHAGRWLRADPAHLRVEIAGVRMLACGDLGLTPDEVEGFAATVRPLFDEAGWRWHAAAPQRWYVQPDDAHPPLGGDAPDQVLGAYIDSALPPGEAGRATRRWLNELQMALHDHPLNRARRERGLPELNSLWLHGDGVAPRSLAARVGAVWSQDPLVLGATAVAGVPTAPVDAVPAAGALVDARSGDATAMRWIAEALRTGRALDLALDSGERFAWRPWHRLRVWRREPA